MGRPRADLSLGGQGVRPRVIGHLATLCPLRYDQGCGLAPEFLEQDSLMKRLHVVVVVLCWPVAIVPLARSVGQEPSAKDNPSRYEYRKEHDPNGIGKFYMGREIAIVMGHQAAEWLDRPEREREEH